MDDALVGDVVERAGIAGGAAAGGFRHFTRLRERLLIRQGIAGEQRIAAAGAAIVIAAPDFGGPVRRLAGGIDERAHLHQHGRALGLVDEFFLAPQRTRTGAPGICMAITAASAAASSAPLWP